jgi:hypothetical protein
MTAEEGMGRLSAMGQERRDAGQVFLPPQGLPSTGNFGYLTEGANRF